jgi:hypothetical protein
MRIRAILECVNSVRDLNGNCYWGFSYTDTETGKKVCGTVSGGESNVTMIIRALGMEWANVYYIRRELPKREFSRLTKSWNYAGCAAEALADYIQKELKQ